MKTSNVNGFAFFSLVDADNMLENNDPCHCFVPIDEVADPESSLDSFELSQKEDPEDVLESSINEWESFDFSEIECSSYNGRISVAVIDVKNKSILLEREKSDVVKVEDKEVEEDILVPKQYDFIVKKRKKLHREEKRRLKCGDENRKTFSERKIQRNSRALLAQLKTAYLDRRFFKAAVFSDYDILDTILSFE